MLAPVAFVALLAVAPSELSELTLDVPLYVGADIDEDVLDNALQEVAKIFAPGGIRLRFQISPDSDSARRSACPSAANASAALPNRAAASS